MLHLGQELKNFAWNTTRKCTKMAKIKKIQVMAQLHKIIILLAVFFRFLRCYGLRLQLHFRWWSHLVVDGYDLSFNNSPKSRLCMYIKYLKTMNENLVPKLLLMLIHMQFKDNIYKFNNTQCLNIFITKWICKKLTMTIKRLQYIFDK